jgi:glycosyltransferase involved in cell wall biosynthesis
MGAPMSSLSSVSFFCPAYNDEGNLPELIPAVHAFLSKHVGKFEILIIEDGSPDNTGAVADSLAKKYSDVRVVHHGKNQGYTATLREGFESGTYEYVMYTDGDNQYDITDFEAHLGLMERNDIIAGYARSKAVSRLRSIQSLVFNALISFLFLTNFRDINCSMKLIRRDVLKRIPLRSSPHGAFIDAELMVRASRAGMRMAQFPVVHYARKSGIASGSKPGLVWETFKDAFKLRFGLL